MSSKNVGSQGRRTPLSLNAQAKQSNQQQAKPNRRPSTNNARNDESANKLSAVPEKEVHLKPAPQSQQQQDTSVSVAEKKEVASVQVAPAANELKSVVKEDAVAVNNGCGRKGQSANNGAHADTAGANGNKVVSANGAEAESEKKNTKKTGPTEKETRAKTRNMEAEAMKQVKIVAERLDEQLVKTSVDAASKAAVSSGTVSPSPRKQQQAKAAEVFAAKQNAAEVAPATTKIAEAKTQEPQTVAAIDVKKNVEEHASTPAPIIPIQVNEKATTPSKKRESKTATPQQVVEAKPQPVVEEQQQQQRDEKVAQLLIEPTAVSPLRKTTVTTTIDGDDNQVILVQDSSKKMSQENVRAPSAVVASENPNASSTPSKFYMNLGATKPEECGTPLHLRHSVISGRRSIRPLTDWTPSQFENNSQFRGSYRRIKTELDTTNDTNTSLNVTVGSELGNDSSFFSFRARKRERAPLQAESAKKMQKEEVLSPPKRARFDSIFSVVSSPLAALRSRFTKANLNDDSPVKTSSKRLDVDENEENNVSMGEELPYSAAPDSAEEEELTPTSMEKQSSKLEISEKLDAACAVINVGTNEADANLENIAGAEDADISITETSLVPSSVGAADRKRRCNIM